MAASPASLWSSGDAYERYMGRWSRRIAPLFLDWIDVPVQSSWFDLGCGTGVLTEAVLSLCGPERVVGTDSAPAFLEAADARITDPRVEFRPGDAVSTVEPDGAFDAVVSGLLLNFLPDKKAALAEMVRVTRPGGTVGLYVWDYAGHMQIMRHFFDVATGLDARAGEFDDGLKAPICRPGPLQELLGTSGLVDVNVMPIDIPAAFRDFDDYWSPFLGGTGSAPKYCASLSEPERDLLREELRRRLPTGPDGEILLAVRAWGAKGRRPS